MSETLLDMKGMNCPMPGAARQPCATLDGARRTIARARDRPRRDGRLPGVLPGDRPCAARLERGGRRVQLRHPPPRRRSRSRRTDDMPTALITHPACLRHDTGPYHPECPDRLRAVLAALETPEFADLLRESAPHATEEQLTRRASRRTTWRRSCRSAPPRARRCSSTPTPR